MRSASLGLLATFESLPVRIITSKSDLSNGDGAPVIAITLYGIDTEPRNLKPQAVVNKAGNAIKVPSTVLRPTLGIWLLVFELSLATGLFSLGLMMAPLFP
jgi:hypothetical protein